MDGDYSSSKKYKKKVKNDCVNSCDVLQPSWVRCPIPPCDGVDRIILDYGCNFLWRIGIVLWALFFVVEGIKMIIK